MFYLILHFFAPENSLAFSEGAEDPKGSPLVFWWVLISSWIPQPEQHGGMSEVQTGWTWLSASVLKFKKIDKKIRHDRARQGGRKKKKVPLVTQLPSIIRCFEPNGEKKERRLKETENSGSGGFSLRWPQRRPLDR